ncbi:MAG: hypothetical protein H3C43_13545, partial [Leptonema sp. (in: Bacteria)]|nr:hypothetical protein [Leptonema sp. (in: bacteria)]
MKSISCNYRLLSTSFLMLTFLLGCLKRESDAESINLELIMIITLMSSPAECNGSINVEALPLNQSRSVGADGQYFFRIQRSSAPTIVKITIDDPTCNNYSRRIGYCDWINRILIDAYVNCDSGNHALSHQVKGVNG